MAGEAIGSKCAIAICRRLERACNAVSQAKWLRQRIELLSDRATGDMRAPRHTSSNSFVLLAKCRQMGRKY